MAGSFYTSVRYTSARVERDRCLNQMRWPVHFDVPVSGVPVRIPRAERPGSVCLDAVSQVPESPRRRGQLLAAALRE